LASLLPRNQLEFYDRVDALITTRLERLTSPPGRYRQLSLDEVVEKLDQLFQGKAQKSLRESGLAQVETDVQQRIASITPTAPFPLFHNADYALARLAYLLCRILRPTIVVETGVAYGVTSAFVLKALDCNRHGFLHSVDLPPLRRGSDAFIGSAIPRDITSRWYLHRGASRRVLPQLLPEFDAVDIFIHDSLHTYQNIREELRRVTPYLASSSAVLVDDIQDNAAYERWVYEAQPKYSAVVGELAKPGLLGVAVLNAGSTHQHPTRGRDRARSA
jgi:hypothetical protein